MKKTIDRRTSRVRVGLVLAAVLIAGWIIPQRLAMPVEGATRQSYDQHSFWAYP